jgi:hypothetical protein
LFAPIIGEIWSSSATVGAGRYIHHPRFTHSRGGQQSQLFRHRHDQLLEAMHSLCEFLTVPVPITVRDQPLDCRSGKIGDAARTFLLANTHELTELVF